MDVCNGKDTNDKIYEEYATLECKKSTSIDTIAATVHLKIIFYENIDDDQPIALKISALVVEADTALLTTNINGIYEGYVLRDKVATNSEYLCKKVTGHATATGDNELVRIWLQEARAALTKCVNDSNVEKYMYYLQQEKKIEAGNEDLSQLVMFTWKMKHPFGQVQLGTIKLFKIPGKLIEQVSEQFIKPLIFSLTAERRHHEQVENIAAKNSDVLLKDNQLLLNQLQLMTESRQRDDLRLIARFKEVLNTKKLKLAAKNEELAQLKNQKQHNMPVFVKEEEKVTTEIDNQDHSRGRRKTKSKIVLRKDQTNDDNVVVKRRRQQKIQCDNNISNYHISPSVVEQRTTDKYQAKSLQHTDDKQLQEQELMKINLVNRTSIDENVSEEIKIEATPTVPKSVNMLVNNNCFSADTQIDDIPVEENIPSVNILVNNICFSADTQIDDVPVEENIPSINILVNNNCFSADTQIDNVPVEENIPSVKMLVNNNCFTADTQIGDIPVEENIPSPSIAKNPIITVNYSQNISSNQNNSCQISKKKSILDNLWSGIL